MNLPTDMQSLLKVYANPNNKLLFYCSSNLDTYSTTPDLRLMQSPWASRVLACLCLLLKDIDE